VPRNLTGVVLYPLNKLRHRLPEVYAAHVQKYADREILLEREIPQLNCLWNDVLHFSPVHPYKIRTALLAAGFEIKTLRWFELDPVACGINAQNTIIYLSPPRARGDFSLQTQDFEPYSVAKLAEMLEVPAETIAHFQTAQEEGTRPFLFNHIPHVLFRGVVATENIQVIEV